MLFDRPQPILDRHVARRGRPAWAGWIAGFSLALAAVPALAQPAPAAELLRVYDAPEAEQGVAADARSIYAIGNSEIGRYDKKTGARTGGWTGDPQRFPHLNSCAVIGRELVCASSNYPATPMRSTVEVFDLKRLVHKRSIPLGEQGGSLTWATRHGGAWWACFANYDGKGGEPGRDHTATFLARFDDQWRRQKAWRFPDAVLKRFAPKSASGGVWGADGLLYVTGHDAAEIYVLRVPEGGEVLVHVATLAAPIEGQAISFDPKDPRRLYGINRARRQVVAMRLPRLAAR
jgi:hypothetical protein